MNIHDIEVLLILGRIYRFLQAIHWFVISVKYVQPPQSTRVPIVQNMAFNNENTFLKNTIMLMKSKTKWMTNTLSHKVA